MNYYEKPGYSASAIKAGAVSMLNMQSYIDSGIESTECMRRGTVRHMAILEPERFKKLVVMDFNGRTTAGKALIAEHGRENIIKPAEYEEMKQVVKMVFRHPVVERLGLLLEGKTEVEYFWKEADNIACKAKLDFVGPGYFVEYKTVGADLGRFTAAAGRMCYHLQLGWYHRACKLPCYVVAQQQKKPFDVAVFEVPVIQLALWGEQALQIVRRYESGDRSGMFPDLLTFELPQWFMETEIQSDSESIEF